MAKTVAAVAQATKALGHLNDTRPQLTSLAALAHNLLRSESAASSRIEGVKISHKRLALADLRRSPTHATVIGEATVAPPKCWATWKRWSAPSNSAASTEPFTVADMQDIHRTLLRFTDDRDIAGVIRTKQSWIGGNDYHPIGATYVGPSHEQVPGSGRPLSLHRPHRYRRCRASCDSARPVREHPPLPGWKRTHRSGACLCHSTPPRRGQQLHPSDQSRARSEPKNYVGGLGAYSQGKASIWCERFGRYGTSRKRGRATRTRGSKAFKPHG